MRMKQAFTTAFVSLMFCSSSLAGIQAQAETSSGGSGSVEFIDGEYPTDVFDPENPGTIVDPGESPSTNGALRIDFVPQLNFWANEISEEDQTYNANAQLFHSDTGARGNFVQVSDHRSTKGGWLLQVRQQTQFENEQTKNSKLNGAVISFDRSWANSTWSTQYAPVVSKEIINIHNIGETYNLAQAEPGTGMGTWAIEFGASIENTQGQKDTLIPRLDEKDQPILDPTFGNKPIYQNTAVTLSVPGKTKTDPVHYQTVLTWILSELP